MIEVDNKHFGFRYVVVAQDMGHRCGYVALSKYHPFHGKNWDDIPLWAHGGLTYARSTPPAEEIEENEDFWIGFDCAHAGDARDLSLMSEELKTIYAKNSGIQFDNEILWTKEMVEEECKNICAQLQADL